MENEGSLRLRDKRALRELRGRKEFNELRNKILLNGGDPNDVFSLSGDEGVKYEKLFKQFKDWVPKSQIEIKPIEVNKNEIFKKDESFKLNSREKTVFKELKNNKASLNENEKKYLMELRDKNSLNLLHKKLINGGLDNPCSIFIFASPIKLDCSSSAGMKNAFFTCLNSCLIMKSL